MFSLDSLYFDILFPATARPTPEQLFAGLGGAEIAKTRSIVDIDLDLPQIEAEVSPTFPLRRRGERRIFIVDEESGPLRQNPRTEFLVSRDLRVEQDRLIAVVEATGARMGRMGTFGTWGEAVVVVRTARDLRAVMLLGWGLDPQTDVDGRRRAGQLSQKEFELKLATFDKRLDELDDETIFSLVPPAALERRGEPGNELIIMSVLSPLDGSWDIRKSYQIERQLSAFEKFSRIPGARQAPIAPPEPAEPEPAPQSTPAPAPAPPPAPVGPPIHAAEIDGRVILVIPAERFDLDAITALGKRHNDLLHATDKVTGKQRDAIHHDGGGFVAPLEFLSEVFLDGKPLDKKRFLADGKVTGEVRTMDAHLPRFGNVRIIESGGKRWVTSEMGTEAERILGLVRQ